MRILLSAALMLGTVTGASAQLYDNAPRIVDQNGRYYGRVTNQFDPQSVTNPYGQYGNQFSPNSINNQFGAGNPYNGNRYRIIQGN